jgi:D-alanine-D-alanine ligase
MVCSALRERGHEVAFVDLFMGTEGFEGKLEELFSAPIPEELRRVGRQAPDLEAVALNRKLKSDGIFGENVLNLCSMADVVFLALHGVCGEDGRVQATFDLMGIPYTGSGYLGSAIAMDKDLTKRVVAPLGVCTPAWKRVDYTEADVARIAEETAIPCVVKPIDNGSSIGVYIVHTKETLREALNAALAIGGHTMIEEYVSGRELTIAIFEGKALPSVEIVPKTGFYDYENKYIPGATEEICPAPISEDVEKKLAAAALKVFDALNLSVYARADFILAEDGEVYFLEINTLPGMTPTSLVPQEAAAVGIDYGELCERIILGSLAARKKNN